MNRKKFFKVKKDYGQITEFVSIEEDLFNPEKYKENQHFYWVEYTEKFEEYEKDSVKLARWVFYVEDKNFGDLETLVLGAVYKPEYQRLLPKVDFSEFNPEHFVYDPYTNEWKQPLFDNQSIQIWNTETKSYKDIKDL